MAKLTLYFKDQAEYDSYWGDVTPGSKYLCVIESVKVDEHSAENIANVLITSSNNNGDSGKVIEMGTEVVEKVQDQDEELIVLKAEISLAEEKSVEIKDGPVVNE